MDTKTENPKVIYTTGAFLEPTKKIDKHGKEYWVWYVTEFTDNSYLDGEVFNPKEYAYSIDKLQENIT